MTKDEIEFKAKIINSYLEKSPNEETRSLAKTIFLENPGVWNSVETIRNRLRYRKGTSGDALRKSLQDKSFVKTFEPEVSAILKKIGEQFSPQELQAISNGGRLMPGMAKVPIVNFDGERIRIGALTDTHIGSKFFKKERVQQAFDEFKKEGVDFVTISGDITEGMSNRQGHVYELDNIGYDSQRAEAVKVLSKWDGKMFLIDGNHDRWFIKSNGALIVKDIAEMLPDCEFLGHDEGDISLNGYATLKLWHGEDGSSYAVSYRIQKVVEALSGGEKPSAMFFGHTHKSTFLFDRNIHCYSLGCIQSQSKWMRGKRIAAHVGFWIIDLYVNKQGISKSTGTFYPFYT